MTQAYYHPGEVPGSAAPAPQGLCPEGNYEGEYIGFSTFASAMQGTPGFAFEFSVQGTKITSEVYLTEKTLAPDTMTSKQLVVMGWNGSFDAPEFAPTANPVPLWCKHETYKNKTRERWNISTGAQRRDAIAGDPAIARLCALWKQSNAAPPPVPGAAPKPAPKPSTNGPAAKASAPPPRAPAKPSGPTPLPKKLRASTSDEAWAYWVKAGKEDGDEFWLTVESVAPGKGADALTPEEWDQVAALSGIPF